MKNKEQVNHRLFDVIQYPLITEKTTNISEQNKIVFVVTDAANKKNIKEAVSLVYGVNVLSVNIVNQKGKQKRFRGRLGVRSDVKKAYVTIEQGQVIDIASGI